MLAPVCPSQTQFVLDHIEALRKPWGSIWQSEISARLQVCSLAISTLGDVFLHMIAAATRLAFFAVNLLAHPLSLDIHKNGMLETCHHLGVALRSAFAVTCVSLPAFAYPGFSLTAYEWMALRAPKSIVERIIDATRDLYLEVVNSACLHRCKASLKRKTADGILTVARVTSKVGPQIAKVTTPLAIALTAMGAFFMLDDYLIYRHLHNNYNDDEWMRCWTGQPDKDGVYRDYHVPPSSWYPGFRTHSMKVLHNTPGNIHSPQPCTTDAMTCQSCSRPDFAFSTIPTDQSMFATHRILPAALLVYLSGKMINRAVIAADRYLKHHR